MNPHRLKGIWTSVAAVGLVVISYSDVIIEAAQKAAKDAEKGITVGTIGAVVYAVNRSRRRKAFEKRDARWEAKIDAIMQATGAQTGSLNMAAMNSKPSLPLSQPAECREGVSKVRAYLKKLGKTKFQTYLLTTILNLLTLYLTWSGAVDIDSKVQGYMPVITIVVQLIATGVYQLVEGGVDKASLKATGQEYTTGVTINADTQSDITVSSEK